MTNPQNEEIYDVFLCEDKIGFLHRRGDVTRFEFFDEYWSNTNRGVLSLYFEDNPVGRHKSMRLPSWFSNLLPEGRLREWIAMSRKTSVEREMELLAQVGHDLPGAVRVLTSDQSIDYPAKERPELTEVSRNKETKLWSFSLAGVGLKFSMIATGERLTIPAIGENGDWIVKLPDQRHLHVPQNEWAMMSLAKIIGIEVPDIRLVHRDEIEELPDQAWPSNEQWAYAIKRFDRGIGRQLIHIEDFAQIRGFYPNEKYQGSFETVAALAYRGRDLKSLQEFVRRMTLNILIGNGDAHLKNWSLIYRDKRIPVLSPAYDIVSTFLYRPKFEGPEDMGLNFGQTKRFDKVSLETFVRLEQKLKVKADLAMIAAETVERTIEAWPKIEEAFSSDRIMVQSISEYIKIRAKQFGF